MATSEWATKEANKVRAAWHKSAPWPGRLVDHIAEALDAAELRGFERGRAEAATLPPTFGTLRKGKRSKSAAKKRDAR